MASLCARVRLSSKPISPQPVFLFVALIVLLFYLSAVAAQQDNISSSTRGIDFIASSSSTAATMIPTKAATRSLLGFLPNRFAKRAPVMSRAVVRTCHGATTTIHGAKTSWFNHNQNVCHHPTSALRALSSSSSSASSSTLPTLEQLSKDPFMKQVQYGSQLTSMLLTIEEENIPSKDLLRSSLVAQLSHSDGIRGFMVSFLTRDDDIDEDQEIPALLLEALVKVNNPKELVPLACMNVIMPTAMITMHQDRELAASSAKTSRRGTRLLMALLEDPESDDTLATTNSAINSQQALIEKNCQAILAVALNDLEEKNVPSSENGSSPSMLQYWTDFFQKWGYQDLQKRDIAKVMQGILKKSP